MKIIVNRLRCVFRHDEGKLLNIGLADCLDGLEVFDKVVSALHAHALDFVEAAFENGQESVVFLTELALHPDANRFLSGHPNDRFAQKSRTLLLSSRREALLDTLRRG